MQNSRIPKAASDAAVLWGLLGLLGLLGVSELPKWKCAVPPNNVLFTHAMAMMGTSQWASFITINIFSCRLLEMT